MIVKGTLIHTPVLGEVEMLRDAIVSIDSGGRITAVETKDSPDYAKTLSSARMNGALVELKDGEYLLPGLVDLHIHAPQWPQLGKALHLPLDEWLQRCTFPLEARYADLDFARPIYASLVDNLLANGTTTATYFGTVHLGANKLLAEVALDKGQRALVGKVAMDNAEQCPDFYRDESTRAGLDDTRELIEYIRGLAGNEDGRILPAVTPRFIPSCTDDMLGGLAAIADEYDCHVQTHCSESDWQHAYVIDRHGLRDTQSLDKIGLLTDKTVLAHANLVNRDDMSTIRTQQSSIAHCPLSNLYFSHAVFPARSALDLGLKVGLGTDISGGPSPSILANCHMAVSVSRALEDGVDPRLAANVRGTPESRIDFREAFWMATAGGAKSLGLKVGQLAAGYEFDAIVVNTNLADSNLMIWKDLDSADDVLQKIIYNADRRCISKVWVKGRLVNEKAAA